MSWPTSIPSSSARGSIPIIAATAALIWRFRPSESECSRHRVETTWLTRMPQKIVAVGAADRPETAALLSGPPDVERFGDLLLPS
jgi:hypothetical protein